VEMLGGLVCCREKGTSGEVCLTDWIMRARMLRKLLQKSPSVYNTSGPRGGQAERKQGG
jgi:hypothetical protein